METDRTDPRPGIGLGRVFGIPLRLRPSWFLMAALIMLLWVTRLSTENDLVTASIGAATLVVTLLGSVLLHELGHAFTARRFGIGVRGITLDLLGGYTEMDRDAPGPGAEIAYSLAGPAVSFGLGFAFLGAWWVAPPGLPSVLAGQAAFTNLFVGVYNSLPGLPLDGGRALRAIIWVVRGDQHAGTIAAGWAGRIVAAATIALGVWAYGQNWISLLGVFFAGLVALNLWQNATAAMSYARVAARYPLIDVSALARPVFQVPAGTSIAEAFRRAALDGRERLVVGVTDGYGRLVALVRDDAVAAVPEQRRPWVPVDSVARATEGLGTIPAHLRGEEVINAVRKHPGEEYLVTTGDDVVGVLRIADVVRLLDPRTPS